MKPSDTDGSRTCCRAPTSCSPNRDGPHPPPPFLFFPPTMCAKRKPRNCRKFNLLSISNGVGGGNDTNLTTTELLALLYPVQTSIFKTHSSSSTPGKTTTWTNFSGRNCPQSQRKGRAVLQRRRKLFCF